MNDGPFGTRRVAALDGIRGVAVAAVVAFHSGASWARGGYLGVSLFFTLSGFLIATLLVAEHQRSGRVSLGAFWARRSRRILPPALVTLLAVVVGSAWMEPPLGQLRGDIAASTLYVANLRFIGAGRSYGALFDEPSPVLHFWSLAIEEQFYVLFPLVLLAALWALRGRLGPVAVGLGALAAISAALPALAGLTGDRVYYGTDTRASELLIGAAGAVALAGAGWGRPVRAAGRLADVAAIVAACPLVYWWVTLSQSSPALRQGVLPAHAVASLVLVVAAVRGGVWLHRVLGFGPLVWLGQRSYGLYLYHWPLFVWLTPERTGIDGIGLHAVRITAATLAAAASYRWLEQPILRGVSPRPARRLAVAGALAVMGLLGVAVAVPGSVADSLDFEEAAALARPDAVAGSTLEEIVASADAAMGGVAPPVADDDPVEPPVDTGPPLELQRPEEGLSHSQAVAVAEAAGTGFSLRARRGEDRPPGDDGPAFDYESDAPRVVVFGDSAALMLGYGLTEWGDDTGDAQVLDLATTGCGLVRGGHRRLAGEMPTDIVTRCGDWAGAFSSLRDLLEPQIVVFHYGMWDIVEHLLPREDAWRHVGDPVLDEIIAAEVEAATRLFTDHGVAVVWVTSPRLVVPRSTTGQRSMSAKEAARRVERLNRIVSDTALAQPGVGVVDLHRWFEDLPEGPMDEDLRPDGVHVTYQSSRTVADWLGPKVLEAVSAITPAAAG